MNYTQTQEVNIAMNSNRDLFEKASVPRAVALMAIPTIVTMLVVVIYNMADAGGCSLSCNTCIYGVYGARQSLRDRRKFRDLTCTWRKK